MTEGSSTAPIIKPPLSFRYRCRAVLFTVFFLLFTPCGEAALPGDLLWEHRSPELVSGMYVGLSPAVAPDGTVFFPCGASVDALAPNGALKWRRTFSFTNDTGHYVSMITPTIRRDGTVLVSPTVDWGEDSLFALSPVDGSILWSKPWLPLSIAEGQSGTFILDSRLPDARAAAYLPSLDSNGDPIWSVPIPPASTVAAGCLVHYDFTGGDTRALRRAARVARKTARLHGTPIYVLRDGKVIAEKP